MFGKYILYISSPQHFWHQGPVSEKTIFSTDWGVGWWFRRYVSDGSGGNVSDGERCGVADEASLACCSPPAVRPSC